MTIIWMNERGLRSASVGNIPYAVLRKKGGDFRLLIFTDSIIRKVFYERAFTAFDIREIFLDAVFLWYTPLLAALLISEIASFKAVVAALLSLASIAA